MLMLKMTSGCHILEAYIVHLYPLTSAYHQLYLDGTEEKKRSSVCRGRDCGQSSAQASGCCGNQEI